MVGMSETQIYTFRPPSADDPVLPEVVRRLVKFGSAARGDAGPNSDYDIMVLVPDVVSTTRRSETARGWLILAAKHTSRSVGH